MVVSSIWRPTVWVVEQPNTNRASVMVTATVRIPRVRRFMSSSDLSERLRRRGKSGSIGTASETRLQPSRGEAVSSHQVHHDGDHGQHDENVNESRRDVKREETQSPENQENDADRHQHGNLLCASALSRKPEKSRIRSDATHSPAPRIG